MRDDSLAVELAEVALGRAFYSALQSASVLSEVMVSAFGELAEKQP
jgi:hypothetical protein